MPCKGNCYGNALMESFFGHLKTADVSRKLCAGAMEFRCAMGAGTVYAFCACGYLSGGFLTLCAEPHMSWASYY